MSSPKATGKAGPGFTGGKSTRNNPEAIPAVLAQAPAGGLARHSGLAAVLRRRDLPGAAADCDAAQETLFAAPWLHLLESGGNTPENPPTILLSECSFGLSESADFHFQALLDAEIRIVIAPFFGPALVSDAVRHGILLAPLPIETIAALDEKLAGQPETELSVDLRDQFIQYPGCEPIPFETHPWLRIRLLHGMDNLDEQMRHRADAKAFRSRDRDRNPWLHDWKNSGSDTPAE